MQKCDICDSEVGVTFDLDHWYCSEHMETARQVVKELARALREAVIIHV
jgi:hypothetical protein